MNTAFQLDSKSNSSGNSDKSLKKSTRHSPKLGNSLRTSSPYFQPSTLPVPYDGVFPNDNSSFSLSSQYEYPNLTEQDKQHNHDTAALIPDATQESILTSCSQYPSGHTNHQQHFQSEQHQQQLYQKHLQDHTLDQRLTYNQTHFDQTLGDCSDYDEDNGIEQDFPLEQTDHGLSQTAQHPPRPQSSYEVHSRNFISEEEFLGIAEDYLQSLSPKKREKALLTNNMYQKILMVLLQPKNTQISTAQFRFWAKKMFTLSTTETHHIVCHDGKPVATKECLYDVLVYCHRKSSHGGRDKTSAEVRQHYSWVPKELIARFVKHCPLCSSRRHSLQRPPSVLGVGSGYDSLASPIVDHSQVEEDSLLRHPWYGQLQTTQDSSQIDSSYIQQQHDTYNQPQSESLQQQHKLRIQSEHQPLQHLHTSIASGRYHSEQMNSHQGNHRLRLSSIATNQFSHNILAPLDDSGAEPSTRDVIMSIQYSSKPTRCRGREVGNKEIEMEQEDMNDDSAANENDEMEEIQSESRNSYHFGSHNHSFSGDSHGDDIRDEDSDDCVPSGLVGVPQDVRRFQTYPMSQQLQNPSSLQNRQQSQFAQRRQSHVVHPVQRAHDIFQQRYPSSSTPQPLMGTTVYHPNGHVLHSRHPMHRFSMGQTGYSYNHSNLYSLLADPSGVLLNQSKGTHSPIPIFQRQLSAQLSRGHSYTGTPSIHPMDGSYDGVNDSANHGDESEIEHSENDQIDDEDDDNNNEDIQLDE